jgi:hypothetical protein
VRNVLLLLGEFNVHVEFLPGGFYLHWHCTFARLPSQPVRRGAEHAVPYMPLNSPPACSTPALTPPDAAHPCGRREVPAPP